jgi:death-on-curing protein
MAARRREPVWLDRVALDAIHSEQIAEHGGLPGVRDENALESALARPQQKWHYAEKTDIAALAAAYGFGLARNHPYRDGNKRIAFLAVYTFLGVNGYDLAASEADVVEEFVALAAGHVAEERLADWIRGNQLKSNA